MRKIFLSIMLFLGSVNVVFASTKTYERTTDNLRVPSNVVVNEENINYILNTKAVDASEKIYDFANILTEKEEKKLYKEVDSFVEDTALDLVMLTEKDNLNLDSANYAFNFYDYNNFNRNGLIFFIHEVDNKFNIYMWTSGDVYGIYTQKRIKDILEYIHVSFDNKDTYKGMSDFVKIVHGFYIADKKGELAKIDSTGNVIKTVPWFDIIVLAVALTFVIIFSVFFLKKKEKGVEKNIRNYLNTEKVKLEKIEEKFLGGRVLRENKK